LGYSSSHADFKAYGRSIFAKIEEQVGWEAKPNESRSLATVKYDMYMNNCVHLSLEVTRISYIPCYFNLDHLQALLRSLVLNRMASFDHEATRKEALRRFELHVSGKETIPADIRSAVFKAVMSGGDEQIFQSLLKVNYFLILSS